MRQDNRSLRWFLLGFAALEAVGLALTFLKLGR
jgi:hypothetical protein